MIYLADIASSCYSITHLFPCTLHFFNKGLAPMALVLRFNIQCTFEIVRFQSQFKGFACLCHLNPSIRQLLNYIYRLAFIILRWVICNKTIWNLRVEVCHGLNDTLLPLVAAFKLEAKQNFLPIFGHVVMCYSNLKIFLSEALVISSWEII